MATVDTIVARCPECLTARHVVRKHWMDSIKAEREGKNGGALECPTCKQSPDAAAWHRRYEMDAFQRKGWHTPRMEREGI